MVVATLPGADSRSVLRRSIEATSASIVFWTAPPMSSFLKPANSACNEKVSRVPPAASARRYSPVGRTGPAMASKASRVFGS